MPTKRLSMFLPPFRNYTTKARQMSKYRLSFDGIIAR